MNIRLNGKEETLDSYPIAELLMAKGLPVESLVVEHNLEIVKQVQP